MSNWFPQCACILCIKEQNGDEVVMNDDGDGRTVGNVGGDDLKNGDDKITFAGATEHPGSSHWC